jgi:hypothetical protein
MPMEQNFQEFLHTNERLLCNLRASPSALIMRMLRGVVDALLSTLVVSAGVYFLYYIVFGELPGLWLPIVILILSLAFCVYRKYHTWSNCVFRVTTDRILIDIHNSMFSHPIHTIKWSQYQESYLNHRNMFDYFFNSRPICIRFGFPDSNTKSCFLSVEYAQDLKHYLDKVDSAYRAGKIADIPGFVPKLKE